jgi:hypothetical protein
MLRSHASVLAIQRLASLPAASYDSAYRPVDDLPNFWPPTLEGNTSGESFAKGAAARGTKPKFEIPQTGRRDRRLRVASGPSALAMPSAHGLRDGGGGDASSQRVPCLIAPARGALSRGILCPASRSACGGG